MIVLGYDPGGGKKTGKGKSGIAFPKFTGGSSVIRTAQSDSVGGAIAWFESQCGSEVPAAIGIDTFLHWSIDKSGWRPVDQLLRRTYPARAVSVQPSNSTAGSMAVQGMALALASRLKWENVSLNEVHPKILFEELFRAKYPRTSTAADAKIREDSLSYVGFSCDGDMSCEDEFDAALCCIATIGGLAKNWVNLLNSDCTAGLIYPAGLVTYFWPRVLQES